MSVRAMSSVLFIYRGLFFFTFILIVHLISLVNNLSHLLSENADFTDAYM
jgi:hypothetical protein